MKIIKFLCLAMIIVTLGACTGTGSKSTPTPTGNNEIVTTITPEPTAAPTPTPEATEIPKATEPGSTETPDPFFDPDAEENQYDNPYLSPDGFINKNGTVFELTEEEKLIYDEYVKSLDISIFKDVDPVSIAKINIQCGIDGAWEAEYYMYSEKGLTVTKKEWQEGHVIDILSTDIASRKEKADIVFGYLKDGKFTETEDGFGEVIFPSFVDGVDEVIRLAKNSDGIWLVKYGLNGDWEETGE